MKKLLIVFLLASFFAPHTWTAEDYTAENVVTIRLGIRPFIYELDRDVTVYHWTKKSLDSSLPQSASAMSYLKKNIESFKSTMFVGREQEIGWGLYAAIDPVVTRGIGPRLFSIKLKKGTRVLDIRKESNELSNSLFTTPKDLIEKQKDNKKLKRLVVAAFALENIGAIAYPYMGAQYDFCQGSGPAIFGKPVFLIINNSSVQWEETYLFDRTQHLEGSAINELARIEEMFRHQSGIMPRVPFPFQQSGPQYNDISNWVENNTLICGEETHFRNPEIKDEIDYDLPPTN